MRIFAGIACICVIAAPTACGEEPDPDPAAEAQAASSGTSALRDPENDLPGDTLVMEEGDGYSIVFRYPEEALAIPTIGDSLSRHSRCVSAPFREMLGERHPDDMPWCFEVGYTLEPSPSDLLCLLAWIYEYSGGAHGMSWTVAFVYDTEEGVFIDPVSLLGDSAAFAGLAASARDTLLARFGEGADTAWIEEGTAPVAANYAALLPVPDPTGRISGFRVFFAPYQVAPYVAGPQEVLIGI